MFTILGKSGLIGSHLLGHLREQGAECFTPDRNCNTIFDRHLGHIFYCIGVTADFRSRPFDTVRAHVCVLTDILEKASFDSLAYFSSTRVYAKSNHANETSPLIVESSDPSDLYNLSKLMGESLCLSCGRKNVRVLRLSNVYSGDFNHDSFLFSLIRDAVDTGYVSIETSEHSEKDYVSLNSVIAVLPKIALSGQYRLYNLASGVNVSNGQILAQLTELTGCRTNVAFNAPTIRFPRIDILRLQQEFGFQSASLQHDFPSLVQQYRRHKT